MVDFIRPQIQEGCRLAMPEGLMDLMSDISREVLRAQPVNLYKFIADYLSALMVARENLTVATRLCDTVCKGSCTPELDDELRYIGLDDHDAGRVKKVITDHFERGEVNESSLMIKIAKITNIESSLLPAMQQAVRNAFKRHLINSTTFYETSSDSDLDEIACAAKHTLRLYRKTRHTPEEYTKAAEKIQAAYRAYGVRSHSRHNEQSPRQNKVPEKNIHFTDAAASNSKNEDIPLMKCMPSASSTSLAGSYLNLPRFIPYTVHEHKHLEKDEVAETESANFYYSNDENSSTSGRRKISFQESPQEIVENRAAIFDGDDESSVDEVLITERVAYDDY